MTSPFVHPEGHVHVHHEKKADAYFVHESEALIIGGLIAATLIYLAYSCGSEYFQSSYGANMASLANTQRLFSVNDTARATEHFRASPPASSIYGTVQRGAHVPSQGVSTEKFTEFARIDAIDHLADKEPSPAHQPETSDETLVAIAY